MLSEKLLPLQLLGTVLVLSGVFLVRIGVNNQAEPSEHPAKELV
jgi:drug/metabolite transporter (DMT)-like permease